MDPKLERQKYSEWLRLAADSVDALLSDTSALSRYLLLQKGEELLTKEKINNLEKYRDDARKLAKEIEENHFKVVIAGGMSSGKSALTNALALSKYLLPTAKAECTRVSTEICYHDTLEATVYFKTVEEFKEDLRFEMEDLGYEKNDIDTVSSYDSPAQFCASNIFSSKPGYSNNATYKKLRERITNIQSLWQSLNKEEKTLPNVTADELAPYISDDNLCQAINRIVIKTPVLAGMRNAVIMDMPGFDSTVKTFNELSKDMMKDADAIVIVQDINHNPDLSGSASSVLSKATAGLLPDRLNEFKHKLFLFGNRADESKVVTDWTYLAERFCKQYADAIETADDEYLQYMKGQTIIGSAIAYAPEDGMPEDDKKTKEEALKYIQQNHREIEKCSYSYYKASSSEDNNCIIALRNKLQNYCDKVPHSQRINRAKKIINSIINILEPYCEKSDEENDFVVQFLSDNRNFWNPLMAALNNEKVKLIERGKQTNYLLGHNSRENKTNKLIDTCVKEIKSQMPSLKGNEWINDNTYTKYHNYWKDYDTNNIHAVESQFRRDKFNELQKLFEDILNKTLPTIKWNLVDKLAPIFVHSMGVSESSSSEGYIFLLTKVKEFLNDPNNINLQEIKTNALIHKYTENAKRLFTMLILTPYLSEDRWNYYSEHRVFFDKLGQDYDVVTSKQNEKEDEDRKQNEKKDDSFELQAQMLFHAERKKLAKWWSDELKMQINKDLKLTDEIQKEMGVILDYLSLKYLDLTWSVIFDNKHTSFSDAECMLKELQDKKTESDQKPGRTAYTSYHYYFACCENLKRIYKRGKNNNRMNLTDSFVINHYSRDFEIMIDILENVIPLSFNLDRDICNEFVLAITSIERNEAKIKEWLVNDGLVAIIEKCQDNAIILRKEAVKMITKTNNDILNFDIA